MRNRLDLREAALGLENRSPELEEVTLLALLLARRLNIGSLIDGVELAALNGVGQNLGGLLDTLKEAVVLITVAESSLLVGVVAEHLLAVSTLDLLGGCTPAVLGETENCVVVLAL